MTTQLSAVEGGSWIAGVPVGVRLIGTVAAAVLLAWLLWTLRRSK